MKKGAQASNLPSASAHHSATRHCRSNLYRGLVLGREVGRVGVGICWDQWFPEAARAMALLGADVLLYPTAIGSEPILELDSMPHWRRVMQGHAAANILPVIAANRIGTEKVPPCAENGNQSSALTFYGSSFLTDETGDVLAAADREAEGVITAAYDFEEIRRARLSWGLFRDRRPECYGLLCGSSEADKADAR